MTRTVATLFILLLLRSTALAVPVTLVLDSANDPALPPCFRRCDSPYLKTPPHAPTRAGLEDIRCSGSSQFTALSLDALVAALPPDPVIIDLREESHGFLDGAAVSWFARRNAANAGRRLSQIGAEERERLAHLARTGIAVATEVKATDTEGDIGESSMLTLTSAQAQTEPQLLAAKGLRSLRLPVTDHMAPAGTVVDAFLSFYRDLPLDTWLHFHSNAGQARTTMFMVMTDMLVNATLVSAEDIVMRQELLGGLNLFAPVPTGWKQPLALKRADFLRRFYEYAADNPRGRPQLWSEWLAQRER